MNTFFITKRLQAVLMVALFFIVPTSALAWGDSGCCEYDTYTYDTPGYDTYTYNTPAYDTYTYSTPSYDTYTYTTPGYDTYSYTTPTYDTYTYNTPAYDTYTYTNAPTTYDTYTYQTPSYAYNTYDYYDYDTPSSWTYDGVTYDSDWHYDGPVYTGGNYQTPVYDVPIYTYNPPVYTTPVTPTPSTQSPVCSLTVSDSSIERGDTVTLRWDNTYARRMYIDDSRGNRVASDTSSNGSVRVSPTRTTTYTMTVTGTNGNTTNCSRTVNVDTDDTTNDSDAPVCHLHISDTVVRRGSPVLLTWDNSNNSRDMYIRDSNGNRIVESTRDEGRYTVVPSRDTTYTMHVSNSRGADSCSVSVDVRDTVASNPTGTVTIDRVPLTNVPYTGFDAGPYLTTLFYLLLGVWAVAIAYYVMRRKYGVATPAAAASAAAPVAAPAPVATSVATAPVAGHPVNLPTDAGFAEMFGTVAPSEAEAFSIVQYASSHHVFITDEVVAMIAQAAQTPFAQKAYFDAMVAKARGKYPTEHGWLTIDSTRAAELH